MVHYNQYDFSTYIECWEDFVGENTPDDEEVWEIAKESESCPVFENIYQELLLMRVENKIVSDAAKKAIEYLKNYNSNAEEKISIPESWEVQSKIEESIEINWYVNARDTNLNVKIPYFNGGFEEFCEKSNQYYRDYEEGEDFSPDSSQDFEDLIDIVAFYYCYQELSHLLPEAEEPANELIQLFKMLKEEN